MKSWKTTLGGALAGLGAAVMVIDPEWAKAGALVTAFGTFFGLLFARDNNVSSEDAGAKKSDPRLLSLALLAVVAFAPMGCANQPKDPKALAFVTLADTWAGVKGAMALYTDAYAAGKVSETDRAKIDDAYVKFRVSLLEAIRLAEFQWSATTPDNVALLSNELLALVAQLNL